MTTCELNKLNQRRKDAWADQSPLRKIGLLNLPSSPDQQMMQPPHQNTRAKGTKTGTAACTHGPVIRPPGARIPRPTGCVPMLQLSSTSLLTGSTWKMPPPGPLP